MMKKPLSVFVSILLAFGLLSAHASPAPVKVNLNSIPAQNLCAICLASFTMTIPVGGCSGFSFSFTPLVTHGECRFNFYAICKVRSKNCGVFGNFIQYSPGGISDGGTIVDLDAKCGQDIVETIPCADNPAAKWKVNMSCTGCY